MPDIQKEQGEIRRVSKEVFHEADAGKFFLRFREAAKTASLLDLSEDAWSRLENTDSHDITPQNWVQVEENAIAGHSDHPRDWQLLRTLYEQDAPIEAPIVLKTGNTLHLVAGNTRLMVARALGITPKILLVELPR